MRLMKGRSFYKEPWYNSYRCMKSRCYRPKDPSYKYYGGRGIKVCDEWLNIENFEKWVKEHPFFEGATLDRINVDGDYEPSNCRKTLYYQTVWIFEQNAYDQNMPLFKGTVNDARKDTENVWDYLMCEVDHYEITNSILDIRVRDEYYEERLEGHYSFCAKNGEETGKIDRGFIR